MLIKITLYVYLIFNLKPQEIRASGAWLNSCRIFVVKSRWNISIQTHIKNMINLVSLSDNSCNRVIIREWDEYILVRFCRLETYHTLSSSCRNLFYSVE